MSARIEKLMDRLAVLVVDGNHYTRRLTRMMLANLGIRSVYEAGDGVAALEAIRTVNPDVMILDWDLPVLTGQEVMRIVRAPGSFPKPNLPIIMLTDTGKRSRIHAAMRLGVHEMLVKPVSPKLLQLRLIGLMLKPRPMIRAGRYYVPMPRRKPDFAEILEAA